MNDDRLIVTLTVGELKELISEVIATERSNKSDNDLAKDSNVDKDALITRLEVAEYFKVSTVTLDKWIRAGILPKRIKMASRVYYLKEDIQAMIKA